LSSAASRLAGQLDLRGMQSPLSDATQGRGRCSRNTSRNTCLDDSLSFQLTESFHGTWHDPAPPEGWGGRAGMIDGGGSQAREQAGGRGSRCWSARSSSAYSRYFSGRPSSALGLVRTRAHLTCSPPKRPRATPANSPGNTFRLQPSARQRQQMLRSEFQQAWLSAHSKSTIHRNSEPAIDKHRVGEEKLLSRTRGGGSEREQSRTRRQEKHTVKLHSKRAGSLFVREVWEAQGSGDVEISQEPRGEQVIAGGDGALLSFSVGRQSAAR